MSDYSAPRSDRKPFGKKPFGNKSFGNKGGFDKGPRPMFTATCAKCGNTCEVPFRPNGAKPVYCNNCFVREGSDDRAPRRDFAPRAPFQDAPKPQVRDDQAFKDLKAELRGVNERLDRMITLMTQAAAPAPKAEKVSKKKVK